MVVDTDKLIKDYKQFCEAQYNCDACPLSRSTGYCNYVHNINKVYPIIQKWLAEHMERRVY